MFNIYNAKFQNRETMIQELQPQSANFLYWILGRYLKKGLLELNLFFQIIRNVHFSDTNNQNALEDIDVGVEAKVFLNQEVADNKIGKEQFNEFLRNCLEFYITALANWLNGSFTLYRKAIVKLS